MSKKESRKSSQSNEEVVDFAVLSKNPATEGLDTQAVETWIYPTNYPLRDYQYSIIQEALLSNTMVSLPTGLGKTFIAAVVMYNYYRWYPIGKVIFMAPTRPLVKQQIDACYNIMAIPKAVTAELTGTKAQAHRTEVWKQKRVFFITPQVLQNDLDILIELGSKIKCIVFDEAHKAKGNYAYCEIIKKLLPLNKYFRVVALSATPGSSHNDVSEVIRNLLISRLEIRTDDSPDVTPYVFQRSLETVVVPLGEKLQQVRDDFMQILEKYTRILVQHRVITGNCSTLTKGRIFMTMKDFQARSMNNRERNYADIMRNLNLCVTLYHGYELLIRHGLRGFLSFFEEHAEKPLLRGNMELQQIMQDVREYLGPAPNVEPLPDGTILEIPLSTKFGHPKFYKLQEILISHFNVGQNSTESRVIVFCEYRESVMEAYALLLRQTPIIRAKIFLGKGGITQKQQINVVKAFKEGQCNTLVSTSIGEEGLDVGEVDLIVCFDINNKSPIRMVQRMGRTGRKREGRVVVLVTEGKEQQTLKECLIYKQNLSSHILQSSALAKDMYVQSPRMIPLDVIPKCHKMHITVTVETKAQTSRKNSNNLKDMFDNISNKNNDAVFSLNCDIDVLEVSDKIPSKQEYWNKGNPLSFNCDNSKIDFSKKLVKLRALQPTGKIGHTKNSELLVSLLQFAESKKYNIPMTQVPIMPSQVKQSRKFGRVKSSDCLKQVDIRNMFAKPPSGTDLSPTINRDAKTIPEEQTNKEMLNILYTEISTYLAITVSDDDTDCKICDSLFDCSQFTMNKKEFNIKTWIEPDFSVLNNITVENLKLFEDSLKPKENVINTTTNIDTKMVNLASELNDGNISVNFEDSFKQSPFKPPKNIQRVLEKSEIPLNLNETFFNNIAFTQMEDTNKKSNSKVCELNNTDQNALMFFNITALEEVFQDPLEEEKTPSKVLHLPSSTPHQDNDLSDLDQTIIYTPPDNEKISPVRSPILSSYERVRAMKNRTQKRLFDNSGRKLINNNKIQDTSMDIFSDFENTFTASKPKLSKLLKTNDGTPVKNVIEEENSSDVDIIDTTLDNCFESIANTQVAKMGKKQPQQPQRKLSVSDMFDLSAFGLDTIKDNVKLDNTITNKNNVKDVESSNDKKTTQECADNLKDFCDETFIDIFLESDPFKEEIQCLAKRNIQENNVEKTDPIREPNISNAENIRVDEYKETPTKKDGTDSWKEDSIWDFFLSQNKDENVNTTNTAVIKNKDCNEKLWAGNIYNEQSPSKQKSTELIDLTHESPEKAPSPSLIKSQRSGGSTPFKSLQNKKLPTLSQDNKNSKTLKTKLQLNSNNAVTSMGWFNRINTNQSKPTETITSPITNVKSTLFEDDDLNESFNFTFNKKKPVAKLSLKQPKVSPVLESRVKTTAGCSKFDTTPKKFENKRINTPRKILNPVIENVIDSSDDDFELPRRTTGFINPRRTNLLESPLPKRRTVMRSTIDEENGIKGKKKTKQKFEQCPFIDLEAELSMDEYATSDTDCEEIKDFDKFEESFMDDETQNIANNTAIHAHYLQSVRSPLLNRGKFKIPSKPSRIMNVYSQPILEVENTYINDTFCVTSEEMEFSQETKAHDISELELAELLLEQERTKRKRRKKSDDVPTKKRRRILEYSSDSD